MEVVAPGVEVGDDRLEPPVAVAVDDVAPVALGEQRSSYCSPVGHSPGHGPTPTSAGPCGIGSYGARSSSLHQNADDRRRRTLRPAQRAHQRRLARAGVRRPGQQVEHGRRPRRRGTPASAGRRWRPGRRSGRPSPSAGSPAKSWAVRDQPCQGISTGSPGLDGGEHARAVARAGRPPGRPAPPVRPRPRRRSPRGCRRSPRSSRSAAAPTRRARSARAAGSARASDGGRRERAGRCWSICDARWKARPPTLIPAHALSSCPPLGHLGAAYQVSGDPGGGQERRRARRRPWRRR